MAFFKNLSSSLTNLARTHILLIALLLLSLLFLSASQTNHSPSVLASALTSRLLFAANYYISPFSSVSSSSTCLVLDSESNCTLSSVTAVERTSRKDREYYNRMEKLSSCDIFNGQWIIDDSEPLYSPSCPFIDDAFNCFKNGRPDSDYLRYKWKPNGCQLPRLVPKLCSFCFYQFGPF